MAGKIVVSTLNNDTGVLATQNGMNGIAKAWVNFQGTSTVTIRDSFNVSSITDNGTGDYTVNFTTAMPNANYSVAGLWGNGTTRDWGAVLAPANLSTSSVRLYMSTNAGAGVDIGVISASIFSS